MLVRPPRRHAAAICPEPLVSPKRFCHAVAALRRFSHRREKCRRAGGRASRGAPHPRGARMYKRVIGLAEILFSGSTQAVAEVPLDTALSDPDSLEVKCSSRGSQAGQLSTFSVDNDVHRLYKPILSSNWEMSFACALKSYAR